MSWFRLCADLFIVWHVILMLPQQVLGCVGCWAWPITTIQPTATISVLTSHCCNWTIRCATLSCHVPLLQHLDHSIAVIGPQLSWLLRFTALIHHITMLLRTAVLYADVGFKRDRGNSECRGFKYAHECAITTRSCLFYCHAQSPGSIVTNLHSASICPTAVFDPNTVFGTTIPLHRPGPPNGYTLI